MKRLMIGAAALAILTGCGGQSSDDTGLVEQTLKEITVRAGDPAEAAAALTAMNLSQSGAGPLNFADSSLDGAKAVFTDLTIGGSDALTASEMTLEGLDMVDGVASFGKLTISDVTLSDEENDEGSIALGSLEMINPSPELATWLAATLNGQEAAFPSADKVSFDSWSISDLTGEFEDEEANGTIGIGKIEIRDMGDLKAARALMSDISFDILTLEEDVPLTFSVDKLQGNNLDAKFVTAIQENIEDEEAMMAAIMDIAYENPMDPGYDRLLMENMKLAVGGIDFALPSIDARVQRNGAGQPVKYVTKPYEMTLKADAEGAYGSELLQGLSVIGYEELTLKGESLADYDPDKDIISFDAKKNYLTLVDGATLRFGGKIEGYEAYSREAATAFDFAALAEGEEPDPMAMQEAMGKMTIHKFEFTLDDDSLIDRAINAAATMQGQDPAQMKAQINMGLGMAPMMAGQVPGLDVALLTDTTSALGKLISDGGSLTIKMEPSTPLNIGAAMANPDPANFTKSSLGYSATHKK